MAKDFVNRNSQHDHVIERVEACREITGSVLRRPKSA